MTYRTRVGILIGFIALFLVTAPLVVLYTAGYRWNEKKFRLEKVGIIFLRSRPSGADIYLDGKLRKESTPARVRDLLPDTYEIKVSKNGYTSWTKSLAVESARTTFAEGIILWKNVDPEKLALAPEQALTADELASINRAKPLEAAAGGTVFKSDGFEIWTEKTDGSERETITRLSDEIRAVIPYTDTGWVIYETATQIHAVERDGRDVRNDFTLAWGGDFNGLAVSSDGKTLYYLSGKGASASLWRRQLQ
jgi:hypothetical protein